MTGVDRDNNWYISWKNCTQRYSQSKGEIVQQTRMLQDTTHAVALGRLEPLPTHVSAASLNLSPVLDLQQMTPTRFWNGALLIHAHGCLFTIEHSPKTLEEFIEVFKKIAAEPQLLISWQFDRRFLDLVAAQCTHPQAAMAIMIFLKLVEANRVKRYQNTPFLLSWGSVLQELDQRLSMQIPHFSPLLAAVLQSPLFRSRPGIDNYTALRGTNLIDGKNSTLAETLRVLVRDTIIPRPEQFLSYTSLVVFHNNFRLPLPLDLCVNLLIDAVVMAQDDWYLDFIHRVMRINLIPLRDPSLQPTLELQELAFYFHWIQKFQKNGSKSNLIFNVCLSLAPITNFSILWSQMIPFIEINLRDFKILLYLIMEVIRYHPSLMITQQILNFLIDNIRLSTDEADLFSAIYIISHYASRETLVTALQNFPLIPYKSHWAFLDETAEPTKVAKWLNLMLCAALGQPTCSYSSPSSGSDMILFNAIIRNNIFPFKLHSNTKFMAFQSNALLKHLLGRLPAADIENLPENVKVLYVQSNLRQIFAAIPLLFDSTQDDANDLLQQFIDAAKKFRCVPEACARLAELKESNLLSSQFLNYEEQLKDDTAEYDEELLEDTADSDYG